MFYVFLLSSMFEFVGLYYEECTQYQHSFSVWKQSLTADSYSEKVTGGSTDLDTELEIDSNIHSILLSVQKVMGRHKEKLSAMNGEGKKCWEVTSYPILALKYISSSDSGDIQGVKSLDSFTAQILEDLHFNLVSFMFN